MLSIRHRKEGFMPSILCFCAFFAICLGIMSIVINTDKTSIHQKDAALYYIDQAKQLSNHTLQAKSLYELSEQSMINAIIVDPFDPIRWQLLSEILFTLGKDQSAMIAQKMAHRLKPTPGFDLSGIEKTEPRFKLAMTQSMQR